MSPGVPLPCREWVWTPAAATLARLAASALARHAASMLAILAASALALLAVPGHAESHSPSPGAPVPAPASASIPIFHSAMLHFHASPDSAARFASPGVVVGDHGRLATVAVRLKRPGGPYRIYADLTLRPTFKDERTPFDRYDRAGNIRLVTPGRPDLEIVRFITSYGGRTDHTVEVSDLSPLLAGPDSIRAHVDTWLSPAWQVDFALRYVPDTTYDNPSWAAPVYYTDSFNREAMPHGVDVPVDIPNGLARVVLKYVSTGHCTDGQDEDEFVSKANVISVDGHVVARLHPWRSDCRQFRDRNPYCARWADGSWSSDYSRSGWCPGEVVTPTELDFTDALTPGRHTLHIEIENMRPKDANNQYGYWRVSAYVVGWDHPPKLWRN